ncbi:damage-inducible protein DinB [Paenibacillus albiflavus]|uniref:Damage-inducible protein DinB n=1 Tax=Paenibacillus albiflavus TaxID=2545760 RepID=A0A4R4E7I8_9BACL|nr:DinB family protein [Paenibacillus albiflavus]TCZ74021.1 damage-inducible protein DinB [Paenibacillus albiflavus]
MYRTVSDFLGEWDRAVQGTTAVLKSMTDDKLGQAIVEGHNTLGWLGWHLSGSLLFFSGQAGLTIAPIGNLKIVPTHASEIVDTYVQMAESFKQAVEENLTDEKMVELVDSFGGQMPRGAILRFLMDHQTHHRGQMMVLLRQAGLPVPGVMGPTKEGN